LTAPEIAAGAVLVAGVVVVGIAIKKALDDEERFGSPSEPTESAPRPKTVSQDPSPNRKPEPRPAGQDLLPPVPTGPLAQERHPECKPVPVRHLGGNDPHNKCADLIPNNSFPGWDVLVNGKSFDALVFATRTLWDVKTDDFDKHSPHSQRFFVRVKLPEIQREKQLAEACGFRFVVGVRSAAHKDALLELDPDLTIVVMNWC
jgi:hypothetical protein